MNTTPPLFADFTRPGLPEAVPLAFRMRHYAQEQQEVTEWAKEYPSYVGSESNPGLHGYGFQPSLRHMNIEQLLSEVGLRFLYDFDAVRYGRPDITPLHQGRWDGRPLMTMHGWFVPPGRRWDIDIHHLSVYDDFGFVNTILEDIAPLCHTPSIRNDNTQNGTTFADIEADLPSDLQGRLLPICNHPYVWGGDDGGWRGGNPSPYTMEDKVEIRHIRHMWLMCDDYMCGQDLAERLELLGEDESYEEESDEEEGMGEEERKEMCGKALEILESIMEKEDQRLCEGDFVELCNVLKELHKT